MENNCFFADAIFFISDIRQKRYIYIYLLQVFVANKHLYNCVTCDDV